jgi:hypothetical protein
MQLASIPLVKILSTASSSLNVITIYQLQVLRFVRSISDVSLAGLTLFAACKSDSDACRAENSFTS